MTLQHLRPALACLALLACHGGRGTQPEGRLTLEKPGQSGDNQRWSVGHTLPLPLRVRVLADGAPAAGVQVEWTAVGQGIVSPASSTSDSTGVAVTRWTMGTVAGDWTAEASVAGAGGSPVVYTANAYPNFAFQLSYVSGDGQSGAAGTTLPQPLVVLVGDEFNNPYPGGTVTWSVVGGVATLTVDSPASGSNGQVNCRVTLGTTPGVVVVRAMLPGAGVNGTIDFTLTAR